ncbi:ThiJ/PfpI family protein [Xylariales sp. AK1849]|nr:ThiJ/PfpI family protein [Xylariales sp. AK1849]
MAQETETTPLKYGVVVFRGFQALDVFGPLDILNLLSASKPLKLSIIAASLNSVSTALTSTGFGQSIVPTHTFQDAPADIEVLLVPGGLGTREYDDIAPVIDFVREVYPKLRYLLTVCTGSVLVAKTGALDGRRATSNKRAFKWAKEQGPNVNWVVEARWVVDGNVWTSSGISAGIDMMYAFVADQYGHETAEELANKSEYRRSTDPTDDPFASYVHE